MHFDPQPVDNTRLAHLCGPLDENLRQISAALDVTHVPARRTIHRQRRQCRARGRHPRTFYAIANKPVSVEEVQLALVEQRANLAQAHDEPAILTRKPAPDEDELPMLEHARC